ncbi:MAG: hypothetical protein ACXAD7_11320, partial [Candidatus Kariarchaeaceae archaeon]
MKGFGVALTQKGQEIAGKIVRRRRIGDIFLNHLGFDFYSIQKQIYQLNITNDISDRIEEEFIRDEHETRCSHGYLVPGRNGMYQFEQLKPLSQFDVDTKVQIIKIPESPFYYIPQYSPAETNYFLNIYNNNLVPDQTAQIISRDSKFVTIETDSGSVRLPISNL